MSFHVFKEFEISANMGVSIVNYIKHKNRPGSFLSAIICNDLISAVEYADSINMRNIPAFVEYFYNYAPFSCWGSKEKMENWLKE